MPTTGENIAWNATNALRSDLVDHCLGLDMSFHKGHTPGEMIQRVDGDVMALGNLFSRFLVLIVGNLLLMLGALVMLFLEDWRVGAGLSAFAVLTLGVLALLRRVAIPHFKRSSHRTF